MDGNWRCSCGELILHGYRQCWKCGAVRLADGDLVPSGDPECALELNQVPPPEPEKTPEAGDEIPAPVSPDQRWRLWAEVAAVVLFLVFPLASFAFWNLREPPSRVTSVKDSLTFVIHDLLVLAPVLYLLARSGMPWKRLGFVKPRAFPDAVLTFVVLVLEGCLRFALIPVFLPPGWHFPPWPRPDPSEGSERLLFAFAMALNAFAQEVVLRAYLISRLETLFGSTIKAVVVSGALFAAYHLGHGMQDIFPLLVSSGLWYATIFAVTRRIWPLVAVHATWNIVWSMSAK